MKELTAKTWDMIITIHPFTHELIEYVSLFEDHLSVIMNPKHPLSEKHFLTVKNFEKENFISLTRKEDDLFWKYVLLESGVQLERFMTVEQSEAVISLVKMGLGLSLFPNCAV